MIIKYKNKKTREKYSEFKTFVLSQNNLNHAYKLKPSLQIKKLKDKNKLWAARLNDKYRINFECNALSPREINEITIWKIHPHKYKK